MSKLQGSTELITDYGVQMAGADKSLARPGRKQAGKHIRDAHDFNNLETLAVISFFSCKASRPKKFTPLARFLPGRAKDLSAPLYKAYVYWDL